MTIQPGFGQRLRAERISQRLSQADLAEPGISASYVSLLESGRRQPALDVVARIARRLGTDAHLLLYGVDAERANRARMELAFARLCLGQGDVAQAAEILRPLVSTDALSGEAAKAFDARLALAEAEERLGDLDAAVRRLEALRVEAQRDPQTLPWLPTVTALSRCYREAGDIQRAVDVAEQALDRSEPLQLQGLDGHPQLVATLALAHFDRGDLLRAALLLDELLDVTRTSDRRSRAAACWNAALVASGRGQHGEALRLGERAAALLAEGNDERALARLKVTRAWILLAQNPTKPKSAKRLLADALPLLRQFDSAGAVASAEVELARCEVLLGRPDRARDIATQALDRLGSKQPLEMARARSVLGEAQLALGDAAGHENLAAAAALLSALGSDRQAAGIWRQVADVYERSGNTQDALAAYRRALDAAGLRGTLAVGVDTLAVGVDARPAHA